MTANTHPIDKEQVMAYLDGELRPDEAARVAMHLDQCAGCAQLASELRAVSARLLTWAVEPAPQRITDEALEELNSLPTKSDLHARGKQPRHFAWQALLRNRWAWAGAGAGVVALCVLLLTVRPGPNLADRQVASREAASELSDSVQRRLRNQLSTAMENYAESSQSEKSPAPVPVDEASRRGPMIARTASLNISVRDFNAARASADRVVRSHQGYVSSLNISTEKGAAQSLTGKLMIPAAQLDAALADLKALGRVEQEQQGSEEVTTQVVDLDARLKNARETETQLTDILRTRAGKIGDVLEVEKEMARVRGEIESMEAQRKQLHDRVDFGSIDLTLAEEYQAQLGGDSSSAGRRMRNALVDGYHAAADGLLGVGVFLFSVAPSLLLWGLILFWPGRWAWRRWQKSRAQNEPNA